MKLNMKQLKSKTLSYIIVFLFLSGTNGELLTAFVVTGIAATSYLSYCKFFECCDDNYIPFDTQDLNRNLTEQLYGQPMVNHVIHALNGHMENIKLNRAHKALTISFHGWPGNGKNFVAYMIADALYKKGRFSKYFKMYVGRHHFPDPALVNVYRKILVSEIKKLLSKCPRSLIVFDEVNDIPPGIIDAIKPMIDFHGTIDGVDFSQAVFILLSNIGGGEIMERYVSLNKPRDDITLSDFENVIRSAAYVNKGGLKESHLIYSNLIDHYIPFLPLEESHVRRCVIREFKAQGFYNPPEEMIKEVMAVITYGPENNPIFANAGCKRVHKQVSFVISKSRQINYTRN